MVFVPPAPPPPPFIASECREPAVIVTYTENGTCIMHEPTGTVISVLGPSQKPPKPERRPTSTPAAAMLEKQPEEPRAPKTPEPEPLPVRHAPPVRQRKAAGSWSGAPLGVPSL